MTKKYSSFSEVNERLRILKLQREINKEGIKLYLNRAKTNLYPPQILEGTTDILQKMLLTFAIEKLSGISGILKSFRKKERVEVLE